MQIFPVNCLQNSQKHVNNIPFYYNIPIISYIILRGRCNYPKYIGPLKTDKGFKGISHHPDNFVKVGPLKKALYGTTEWLSGSKTGRVEGTKINGRPINFRRCQKLCNSTKDCKSFLYVANKDMNKRTGDTYETKGCTFFNKTCNDAGEQCITEKINLDNF